MLYESETWATTKKGEKRLVTMQKKSCRDLKRLNVTWTPVRNYRLSLVWKTRKRVKNDNNDNREEIYDSLISRGLFPEKQKGWRKGIRGKRELLCIDQHIPKKSKTIRKNLATVWIGYKKAYYRVPQSWIIYYLKMYKISGEVIKFIENTMENGRVELTGEKT